MTYRIVRPMLLAALLASGSPAATIALQLINSFDIPSGTFGLAFDGTYIYYTSSGEVRQMTTAGVDTGVHFAPPAGTGGGALAWDTLRNQLAATTLFGHTVHYSDVGGGNESMQELGDPFPFDLITSLDIDHGEIWLVPDYIGQGVYRFSQSSGAFSGPNPFLAGLGNTSAERTDSPGGTFILAVINKPHNGLPPSSLCVFDLSATELGCHDFADGEYYFDMAFDGRYIWAADPFRKKLDRYDVLSDSASIFIPEPNAGGLLLGGLSIMAGWIHHTRTNR